MESDQNISATELESGIEIIQEQEEEVEHKHNGLQTVFAKFMEEKHSITYRKLVVPQSMRSIYWKFFGFPADDNGEILTRVKIVCLLCKTQIAYNRNTSNLRMHLQNKHVQELHDLEALSPPRKQVISQESKERRAQKRMLKAAMASSSQHIYTTNADGTVHIGGDIQFVTDPNISFLEHCIEEDVSVNLAKPMKIMIKGAPVNTSNSSSGSQNVSFVLPDDSHHQTSNCSNGSTNSLSEAIVEFIIIDLQLPKVMQEQGFQRLVATLNSPCEIPTQGSLEEDILPKTYDTFRESIFSIVSSLTSKISLAVEEWTSNFGEQYFTFLIYYQTSGETVLESKMLCTIHGPKEWDEVLWENTVDAILKEWCIKIEEVTAIVVSIKNAALLAALNNKGLTVVPCLLHSLQVCAQACFEYPQIEKILSKCRAIIGIIASRPQASHALAVQERDLELELNTMLMDYPSMWTSTYNMLQEMIPRREIITSILSSLDGVDYEATDLTDEQWKIIKDLVEVLEPFKVTIITLTEEKMPLISLLKPLLWQLVSSHLKVKEHDSNTASVLKESLSNMLCDKYADPDVSLLLQIATTLDPRFKEVPYATDEGKKLVSRPIKDMLVKLINEEESDLDVKEEDETPVKRPRLTGMELLLGGLRAKKRRMTPEEKADLELAQYKSEATAPLDSCPLQWWSKVAAKCPNLGNIASRFNCVPVCCPPPQRIPTDAQMVYNAKRAALPPHLVDKLLFLHMNHNLS